MICLATAAWLLVHEFYAKDCCEDQHCHPVPCAEVHRDGGGWDWHGMKFQQKQLRYSPDGGCHVCHNATQPYCVYLPFAGET